MLSTRNRKKRKDAYVGLTQGSKVVRKRSVRYPPVPVSNVWHHTVARVNNTHFLVPVTTHSSPSLTATVRTPATSLPANASVMASALYFFPPRISATYRDWISCDPKLRMGGRAMTIEDGGKGNDAAVQQPVHETARPETGEFKVKDKLCEKSKVGYERHTRQRNSRTS